MSCTSYRGVPDPVSSHSLPGPEAQPVLELAVVQDVPGEDESLPGRLGGEGPEGGDGVVDGDHGGGPVYSDGGVEPRDVLRREGGKGVLGVVECVLHGYNLKGIYQHYQIT